MIRAIALSICLLCSMAALPTLNSSLAFYKKKHHKHRRHRCHSRRWLRRHRAMLKRQRERAAQTQTSNASVAAVPISNTAMPGGLLALSVPGSWKRVSANAGEMRYDVQEGGRTTGTIVLSRLQMATLPGASRAKSLGGVPLAELRRMVIERMFAAGGWVVNDAVREMGGQRVFVVQAASNANGAAAHFGMSNDAAARVAWNYYFTEVNGQIYSLATATTPELAAPLAAETEQVLASLPHQQESNGALAAQAAR